MSFETIMEAMIAGVNVPDNYIVLQSELDWVKLYKAASDKNAIVCVEFFEESFTACRSANQHFLQLARKYSNLPFVQIRLTPTCKWALARKSVGGVDYIPCIVIISFANDEAQRAKFEGQREIDQAIRRGLIHTIIDEFKERRQMVRNLEDLTASEFLKKLVEDNQEKGEEVEDLKKKMEEIELNRAREEQKKERLQLAIEDRERIAQEERRINRPIVINELKHEDDIESLGAGRLKDVFKRLHVNIVGLTEKHELLRKLYEELPELRSKQRNVYEAYNQSLPHSYPQVETQPNTPQVPEQDADNIYALSDQVIEKLPVTKLKKLVSKYGLESQGPFSERSELIHAIKRKRDSACKSKPQTQTSTMFKEEVNELSGKVMELTDKLTHTKLLSVCRLFHFAIVQTHQVPSPNKISQHTVRCKKEGLPDSNKLYTLKGIFNYFDSQLDPHTIRVISEFEVLSTLQSHPNIIYHYALIYDKPTQSYAPSTVVSQGNVALFSVMECLPYSICSYLGRNHKNAAISSQTYLDWMKQLLSAFSYLFDNSIFLRSIKHDNIMYDPDLNTLKLMGFDSAITSQTVPFYTELTSIGDLNSYLAPEILNAIPGPSNFLDYTAHYTWTAGALSYDLACNPSPFTGDRVDPSQYSDHEIPSLNSVYPYGSLTKATSSSIPSGYASLVIRMLSYNPHNRPILRDILGSINTILTTLY